MERRRGGTVGSPLSVYRAGLLNRVSCCSIKGALILAPQIGRGLLGGLEDYSTAAKSGVDYSVGLRTTVPLL